MTVRELIDLLETMPQEARILIAHQPSYPLQEEIANVVEFLGDEEEEWCRDDEETYEEYMKRIAELEPVEPIVYLTATGHPHDLSPYAPRAVFNR